MFLAAALAAELLADPPKKRQRHACRGRMDWDQRLRHVRPSEFRRTYRMTLKTFDFILKRIRGSLVGPNEEQGIRTLNRSSNCPWPFASSQVARVA